MVLPSDKLGFGVAFACSMNSRRVFDLEESTALLGGAPIDNAEDVFDTLSHGDGIAAALL